MSKEEIFAIIDDELEKRKLHTFLLWDFPNDVKKRIEELYQSIDNANPSEALECLEKPIIRFARTSEDIDFKDYEEFDTIQQSLIEFERLDWLLTLPSEQTSSHFTYKDKNLVCMQLAKYSKLMNAFLEYEKAQEQKKVLEILKPDLRLVDNYLQARIHFYDEVWLVIKEVTDEEELEVLKKILGQTQI